MTSRISWTKYRTLAVGEVLQSMDQYGGDVACPPFWKTTRRVGCTVTEGYHYRRPVAAENALPIDDIEFDVEGINNTPQGYGIDVAAFAAELAGELPEEGGPFVRLGSQEYQSTPADRLPPVTRPESAGWLRHEVEYLRDRVIQQRDTIAELRKLIASEVEESTHYKNALQILLDADAEAKAKALSRGHLEPQWPGES